MRPVANRTYREDLYQRLTDPQAAKAYLNAALKEKDKRVFLLALRDVTEANGGMSRLAKATQISREHIYRMLSDKGNPELQTLNRLLDALGLRISIEPKAGRRKAA